MLHRPCGSDTLHVTRTRIPVISHGGCADALDQAIAALSVQQVDTGLCRFLPGGAVEWLLELPLGHMHLLGEALMSAGLVLTRTGELAYQGLCVLAARACQLPSALRIPDMEVAVSITQKSPELQLFLSGDDDALAA